MYCFDVTAQKRVTNFLSIVYILFDTGASSSHLLFPGKLCNFDLWYAKPDKGNGNAFYHRPPSPTTIYHPPLLTPHFLPLWAHRVHLVRLETAWGESRPVAVRRCSNRHWFPKWDCAAIGSHSCAVRAAGLMFHTSCIVGHKFISLMYRDWSCLLLYHIHSRFASQWMSHAVITISRCTKTIADSRTSSLKHVLHVTA